MQDKLVTILALPVAVVGWWGMYELTGKVKPDAPGALSFFLALLFLAMTATLAPAVAYLNRRFARATAKRDGWRYLRHSAWGGLCVTLWAWLQTLRAFNVAFALIIALIFVALEVLIIRLRSES